MIDTVGAVTQAPSLNTQAVPNRQPMETGEVALKQPSPHEIADFARAAAVPRFAETKAAPPSVSDSLTSRFVQQVDDLSNHLRGLGPAGSEAAAPSTGGKPGPLAREQLDGAVAQIERAYMFAIETTMASRGSTETTKIFNTLLKGQ